ncbi:hypothetical protein IGI04_007673 [Brassica rapa subsp. trilocularis]|uniref:SHSP domain-containing protein n=1 Tax=Brassica rapa subsp. trilocularis TaxID=1813537 RepID=A0ABQ7NKJ3_BRACM|nr:hypothetical protein IGI04_007673 [Brassica rapa subsp. trilocularis]
MRGHEVSDISKPRPRRDHREREEEEEEEEEEEMAEARLLDMSRVPFIPACQMSGIHATNNLYQRYGPKGFMEIKILQNDNLYVRVDLPGVPDDGVRHRVDSVRQKVVFFSGEETLSDGDDKKNARVDAKIKDGVLRMIVSRVKVKDHDNKCTHFLPPNTGSKPLK